jgi:hypothetical protein
VGPGVGVHGVVVDLLLHSVTASRLWTRLPRIRTESVKRLTQGRRAGSTDAKGASLCAYSTSGVPPRGLLVIKTWTGNSSAERDQRLLQQPAQDRNRQDERTVMRLRLGVGLIGLLLPLAPAFRSWSWVRGTDEGVVAGHVVPAWWNGQNRLVTRSV